MDWLGTAVTLAIVVLLGALAVWAFVVAPVVVPRRARRRRG